MRRVVCLLMIAVAFPATASARRTVDLTVDNAFGLALVSSGIDAAPIKPATQDSLTLSFPVRKTTRNAVFTRGGFDLDDVYHDIDVRLKNLRFVFSGKRVHVDGEALLEGIPNGRFVFAAGRGSRTRVRLHMTAVGAVALNSQFRTAAFAAGQFFGAARVSSR